MNMIADRDAIVKCIEDMIAHPDSRAYYGVLEIHRLPKWRKNADMDGGLWFSEESVTKLLDALKSFATEQ